jgi:hypothetical protein
MEGKTFVKLAKDCHLLDPKLLTVTDLDLIFAKVKTKGARRITPEQFILGLEEISKKLKGTDFDALCLHICQVGGPSFIGTKTEKVKWHDDKTTYTGVYAKGGPSTVDKGKTVISDIVQLCDRSEADVRGVKKHN